MGRYSHCINGDLFIYCLENFNAMRFLKTALEFSAFDRTMFREDRIIEKILEVLRSGGKTNHILNILISVEVASWRDKYLREVLEIF
jgi:hypothetical protein